MPKEEKTMWVECTSCGHHITKHRQLHERANPIYEERDGPVVGKEFHRLVECMGCETIKYVASTFDANCHDGEERDIRVYPDAPGTSQQRPVKISRDESTDDAGKVLIPTLVWKMYKE